jgi:hypothetical protein
MLALCRLEHAQDASLGCFKCLVELQSYTPAHKATPKVLGTPVLLLCPGQVLPPAEQGLLLLLLTPVLLLPADGAVQGLLPLPALLRNPALLQLLL